MTTLTDFAELYRNFFYDLKRNSLSNRKIVSLGPLVAKTKSYRKCALISFLVAKYTIRVSENIPIG